MKILIIANYTRLVGDNGNCRFTYLAQMLANKNEVEIITSSFSHIEKKQRTVHIDLWEKLNYKITTIHEIGYSKNISLKRIYSHWRFARSVKKYLNNMKQKPDVIYCAVPTLTLASNVSKYAKKHNIRFIIDIQDIWPETFKMVVPYPLLKHIFLPLEIKANRIYKSANDIVAVSQTYLQRGTRVNKIAKNTLSVFLGTDLQTFDKYKSDTNAGIENDLIKIAYIGTLGHSYNIKCIIDAIKVLNNRGINNIQFIIMGEGPLRNTFEQYAKSNCVNCVFTGNLAYSKMVSMLCASDIAVNPIVKGGTQSIINKVGDYAAAQLPVINTLKNIEYMDIVNKYKIGYNCSNDNIDDIANKIEYLINNSSIRKEFGLNNRKLAEKMFDRNVTYKNIIQLIENNN